MNRFRCLAAAPALLLTACGMEQSYYVKPDDSPDMLTGIAHMLPPRNPPAPLDVGVTFKSEGRISAAGTDTLYQTVHDGLTAKGRWKVHRLGSAGEDFGAVIQSIITARAGALPNQPDKPRLLMLVENAPDLSAGTRSSYFLSGMTFGAYSLNKPTDRYDVTIAYRDAQGMERVYRSHQDLYFFTGSKILGSDSGAMAGLKHYDSVQSAFGGIVDNSVNGTRRGTVTAGQPHFETPAATVPTASGATKALQKP